MGEPLNTIELDIQEYSKAGAVDTPPCNTPMQKYLRERFAESQGSSAMDSKARAIRAENARRYARWAESSTLDATGNRPV